MLRIISMLLMCAGVLTAKAFTENDSIKKLPAANWSRQRTIDVKHIALDLHFDISKKQAIGSATITLSVFDPTDKIFLDAAMLTINSIHLSNGSPVKFNYSGGDKNDNLEILLDRVYQADEQVTVSVDYHTNWVNTADPNNIWGSFGKGVRYFQPTATTPIKRNQIWSMGEPQSNRYWFPGYDAINDVRTTEFKATVDQKLMVISNGKLVENKLNQDGTRTFYWKADTPYPNYLTSFVIGEYVDIKQEFDGVPLHTFAYPDEKDAAIATAVRLPDMVKFFSEATGMKYPYSSYSQAVVQDFPFPGLNGQNTVTTISDNMIDDFRTHADFYYLWDGVEAQSLASQWFGNLLMPRDWEHIWLNGSFSHYFDGLFNSYKNGKEEFLCNYVSFDLGLVMSDWNAGYRHPIVTNHYDSLAAFTSDNHVKVLGSLVLRMLHKELGDEKWSKAVRHYVKSNAGQQVSTEDLKVAIEEATGESIGWFFDQWIYKMGHPVFEVSTAFDEKKGQFTLILRQTQKIDNNDEYPQVEFFQGKMEIEIDGKIEVIQVEPKRENLFVFPAVQQPKLVNVDYEGVWIKEITFTKTREELIYQLLNDKDVVAKNWAITQLVAIASSDKASPEDKAKINSAFRSIMDGDSYWRVRVNAMSQLRRLMTASAGSKPLVLDKPTLSLLLKIIKNDKSWVRTSAITFLGMTRDPKYADLYIHHLNDESDRVINAAAIALGKSNSPKAFDALVKLSDRPSWKSQSMISALNGLKELGDPRGSALALKALSDVRSPRWWLNTSVWDYPIAAAETLVALKKTESAYPMIFDRFKKSIEDNDYNDIFANVVLITTLADPRGKEVFDILKKKFNNDSNAMIAVGQYETQFKTAISK